MNNLGEHFQAERLKKGLSLGELARRVGYKNVSKGANRIARFERGGVVEETLLTNMAEALGIDLDTVEDLLERDRQERLRAWETWVNEPVPMCLIVKYLPAVYGTQPLPEVVTTPDQAEEFACEYARQHRRKVCLALSKRQSVWINESGEVEARTETIPDRPNVPHLRLKGDRNLFLFEFGRRGVQRAE